MAITQTITPITPLSSFTSPNRPAEVDNLVEVEIPRLSTELQTGITQINTTQAEINASQSAVNTALNSTLSALTTTQGYRDTAKTYRDTALTYQTAAQLAYTNTLTLVNNLVIPTAATYTYTEADNLFATELDSFIDLKI